MYKIIVFGSKTCVPCKFLRKDLEENKIKYTYIDVEEKPDLVSYFSITSVPTTIILQGDKVIDMYIGNSKKIISRIKELI